MAAVLVHHSSQGVWHIELNNPPCNTLTTEMIVQLDTLLKKAQNDPSCIGVVLSSAVEDYFCVGDDPLELGIMQHMSTPESLNTLYRRKIKLLNRMLKLSVVAAVDGEVSGFGLDLLLCCRARIGTLSQSVRFVYFEWDASVQESLFDLLNKLTNDTETQARVLIRFSAEQAKSAGIITQVVEKSQLIQACIGALAVQNPSLLDTDRSRLSQTWDSTATMSTTYFAHPLTCINASVLSALLQGKIEDLRPPQTTQLLRASLNMVDFCYHAKWSATFAHFTTKVLADIGFQALNPQADFRGQAKTVSDILTPMAKSIADNKKKYAHVDYQSSANPTYPETVLAIANPDEKFLALFDFLHNTLAGQYVGEVKKALGEAVGKEEENRINKALTACKSNISAMAKWIATHKKTK